MNRFRSTFRKLGIIKASLLLVLLLAGSTNARVPVPDSLVLANMQKVIVAAGAVSPQQAEKLAPIILEAARRHNIPLAYFMAAIAQESKFSPAAVRWRGNWLDSDWGIAQINGRTLATLGRTTRDAMNPVWSLDFMAKEYRSLLDVAKKEFSQYDPFKVATLAYNRGRTGAREILNKNNKHVQKDWHTAQVMSLFNSYKPYVAP